MRIDSNGGVPQIRGIRTTNTLGVETITNPGVDSVDISSKAADLRAAMDALKDTPEVRENLVADIRAKLADGTLDVSGDSVVEKLFARKNQAR